MVEMKGNYTEFRFFRPGVSRVTIAGDFNDWREDQLIMSSEGDGYWTARVKLPAGEYRFRYCADGQWYTDYAAHGLEPGRFGMDSMVIVPSRPVRVQTTAKQAAHAGAAA